MATLYKYAIAGENFFFFQKNLFPLIIGKHKKIKYFLVVMIDITFIKR